MRRSLGVHHVHSAGALYLARRGQKQRDENQLCISCATHAFVFDGRGLFRIGLSAAIFPGSPRLFRPGPPLVSSVYFLRGRSTAQRVLFRLFEQQRADRGLTSATYYLILFALSLVTGRVLRLHN